MTLSVPRKTTLEHAANKIGKPSPTDQEILWDMEERFWTSDSDNARATTAAAGAVSSRALASERLASSRATWPASWARPCPGSACAPAWTSAGGTSGGGGVAPLDP